MHGIGLIGGTFDRFHSGHMSLIEAGLSHCKKIEVWITDDVIAQSKDSLVKNWDERKADLENSTSMYSSRISIHLLSDEFGPAIVNQHATAIICTNETIDNCLEINFQRKEKGLGPLEIISVDKLISWTGKPISSSLIRSGVMDREGKPWIPDSIRGSEASLTPQVESELKNPFGQLIEGPEDDTSIAILEALSQISQVTEFTGPIIAVGDVTVLGLQNVGRPADLAFIDGKTKRIDWPEMSEINTGLYDNLRECVNPSGSLTNSLLEICEASILSWQNYGESSLIVVTGEEDLAPLLLHPLAPIGSVVLYGQPGKGVVIRWCDEDSKNRCRNLLMGFEVN